MYTLFILLVMIFIPIPVMMRYMLSGRNAYRGILEGSLSAISGVAIVFLVFWALTGATFFQVLNSILDQITVEEMSRTSSYAMMGLKDLEPDAIALALDRMKQTIRLAIPGIIIIFCMVSAYLNYAVISWITSKSGKKISTLPSFRTFSLPKNIVMGAIIIYVLSYITVNMGIIDKNLMMFNLEMLFTFIFSVQGLAVVFYFGYLKKMPKAMLLIIAGIFIITWIGQTFLFLLGLTDIVLDIRKRFSQTNLKI